VRMTRLMVLVTGLTALVIFTSCGSDSGGSRGPNLPPDTEIVSGPEQGSMASYLVDLSWKGTDEDGTVKAFEFAWHTGAISCTDLDSVLLWHYTTKTESTFAVAADSCPEDGGLCRRENTFCVRAIDNDGGIDPEPAALTFIATTQHPRAQIIYPTEPGQTEVNQSRCVTVRWEGLDDDGEAVAYRWTYKPYNSWPGPGIPYPQWDKTHWSPWSAATEAILPLDEDENIDLWSFFVQAEDNAGAIETAFQAGRNHITIHIDPALESKPTVQICCNRGPCTGQGSVIACRSSTNPSQMDVPVYIALGDTVCFRATFQAGSHATQVEEIAFRVNDSSQPYYWEDASSISNWYYPPTGETFTVGGGIYSIYVWVKDDYCEYGSTNFAYIEIVGS
jgi:hypothetical protein